MKLCVIMVLVSSMLFGQILYEEHFTGGAMQLDWHPWFAYSGYYDSMQVISDATTPEGDGWAGKISNELAGGQAGATYSGSNDLDDYSIEAWIYTTVSTGTTMGPYNGIAMRMDTSTLSYYRFVSDFDDSLRLRLGVAAGGPAVVLRDWGAGEIPGGVPSTSSWHKLKMMMVADLVWCWYDDVLLPDCPIIDTVGASTQGFFGVYVFNFAGIDSTKCDGIIVAEPVGIEENTSRTTNLFAIYPNPFRSATNIRFSIHDPGYTMKTAALSIYDAAGRLVRSIRITPDALRSTLSWDGRDAAGNNLAPGVYFISDEQSRQLEKVVKVD